MRLTKNKWREYKIFNPHNLASRGGSILYIGYIGGENGRMAHCPYWAVVGIGHKVNPDGPWYEYGNKHFIVSHREVKQLKLTAAMVWCQTHFDIPVDGWERDCFGSYQLKGTMKRATEEGE